MPRPKQCARCMLAMMTLAFSLSLAVNAQAQTVAKVEKDSFVRTTVPAEATTGTVSVVTPSGPRNSNPQFVVTK